MTILHTKPREAPARRWTGLNQVELAEFGAGKGPSPDSVHSDFSSGTKFTSAGELLIWNGHAWTAVPRDWWVVEMEGGHLARMSPDYVEHYMTKEPEPAIRHYYEGFRAARDRLERVSLGVEQLAQEVATVQGHPNIGRYIQDRIRQLLCTHPEEALRYGAAQSWCTICFSKLEPADTAARTKELMAHVVSWCKCDTKKCAVHKGINRELPAPTIVVPAIPESARVPELSPIGKLVMLEEDQDG